MMATLSWATRFISLGPMAIFTSAIADKLTGRSLSGFMISERILFTEVLSSSSTLTSTSIFRSRKEYFVATFPRICLTIVSAISGTDKPSLAARS